MLSKAASSTIFWVFGMTRHGIEPRFHGLFANTLHIYSIASCEWYSLYTEILSHWVPISYGLVPHLSKKLSKFPYTEILSYIYIYSFFAFYFLLFQIWKFYEGYNVVWEDMLRILGMTFSCRQFWVSGGWWRMGLNLLWSLHEKSSIYIYIYIYIFSLQFSLIFLSSLFKLIPLGEIRTLITRSDRLNCIKTCFLQGWLCD